MNRIAESSNRESVTRRRWFLSLVTAVVVVIVSLTGQGHEAPAEPHPVWQWRTELSHVEQELAAERVGPAIRAWERARAAARASRQWQGLLAVGDAYLRIGDAVDFRQAFVGTARATYLEALDQALAAASADGELGISAALEALDDRSSAPPRLAVKGDGS
jgi:hypothetical protein